MFELILKITLAHLVGDFVFQSNRMVEEIESKKMKSKFLYFHILIHLGLVLLVTKFELSYIIPALILCLFHLIIDITTKILIKNKINGVLNLLIDQTLHFVSIALFIRYFYHYKIDFEVIFSLNNYLLITALVAVTFVSSIVIKKIMELFNYELPNDGIKDAGKYIGILERLFIFSFVVMSFWEGIGFLIAVKSIFRFGDLKEKKEIKLTEYILIGTLISFGIAISIGMIYVKLKTLI